MQTKRIQTLYAKKMLQQIVKEVNIRQLNYVIEDANRQPKAVLISYEQWLALQADNED